MSRTPKRKNSRSPRFSILRLEVLEERQLLSASPVAFEESAALVSCAELEPEPGQGLVLLDAPGSARVDAIDRERLLISWDWVPSATSYLVEVSDDQGATWSVADEVYLSTRLVVEVPVNSSRYFRVAVKNAAGVSDYSEPIVGEPLALEAPSDLTVELFDPVSVKLTWTPPEDCWEALSVVQRSLDGGTTWTTLIDNLWGGSYYDRDLLLGAVVSYRVFNRVSGTGYSESSEIATFTVPFVAPPAPDRVGASYLDADSTSVAWTRVPGAVSYVLEASSDDGTSWAQIASGITVTGYLVSSVGSASDLYRVRAVNAAGTSEPSEAVAPVPCAMGEVWAENESPSALRLRWLGSGFALRYVVERSVDGENWQVLSSPNYTQTSFDDSGLTPDSEYSYRVTALDEAGTLNSSRVLSLRTIPDVPETPVGLAATAIEPTAVSVVWTEVEDGDYVAIQRSTDEISWRTVAKVDVSDPATFVDEDLDPGTTYYYRIAAVNESGASEFSTSVDATTSLCAPVPPEAPVANALGTDTILLSWSSSDPSELFQLERSDDSGATWDVVLEFSRAIFFLDDDLTSDSSYRYRLSIRTSDGTSAPSREVSARTCSSVRVKCQSR